MSSEMAETDVVARRVAHAALAVLLENSITAICDMKVYVRREFLLARNPVYPVPLFLGNSYTLWIRRNNEVVCQCGWRSWYR